MEKHKTNREWKEVLNDKEFSVLREKGTEMPFTGKYHNNKKKGMYYCAGCGHELFSSEDKFDSGTGWPSFTKPSENVNVEMKQDNSHGMRRIEVLCKKCGGHLGHVFDDGPKLLCKRFCINSVALKFKEK